MENMQFKVDVSTREYFVLVVDFAEQQVKISYFCTTYNFVCSKTYEICFYVENILRVDKKDYSELNLVLKSIISEYLTTNPISYPCYRAWQKFMKDLFKRLSILDKPFDLWADTLS